MPSCHHFIQSILLRLGVEALTNNKYEVKNPTCGYYNTVYDIKATTKLVQFKMQFRLLIAVFCLAGLRFSNAREDLTEETRDELSLLIKRFNNLEEALKEKDNDNMELQDHILELQEKIGEVRNAPFGYFCSYQDKFSAPDSVITYEKLLYSSQSGLQGDSPGIDINTGKFVSGFSGTWRVDFSLYTVPDPGEAIDIFLYKNGEQIPETQFYSHRSSTGSGWDVNTGGRSVLLHLDLGDQLYLATTVNEDWARDITFCVSLENWEL